MASIVSSTLYDESEQAIYPVSHAQFIHSTAVNAGGQSVYNDLVDLNTKVERALALANGSEQVANQLGVIVKYARNNSLTPPGVSDNIWGETFSPPTAEFPYAWKKTTYTWDASEVLTTREIVTTALFPETQIMYTTLATPPQAGGLGGPAEYTAEEQGSQDFRAQNIVWRNYFTGITAQEIYGYMAIRHREAGEPFPVDGSNNPVWKVSLFAQYPIINN